MATPRKHWSRWADSILREDWDDATCATVARLIAWLNQRWARDGLPESERGRAFIGIEDAIKITGCRRPHLAIQRLLSLPSRASLGTAEASLRTNHREPSVLFTWPKYAEFQRVDTRKLPCKSPQIAPSASAPAPSSLRKTSEKKETPLPPLQGEAAATSPFGTTKRGPRTPRERKPEPPEAVQFAADFASGLAGAHAGIKPPSAAQLALWAREARLMLTADQRPLAEAQDLARWLLSDEGPDATWWRPNVQGVPKFRQQYDRLRALQRRNLNGSGVRPGPIATAARNILADIARREGSG
jgi:hypothetical protein